MNDFKRFRVFTQGIPWAHDFQHSIVASMWHDVSGRWNHEWVVCEASEVERLEAENESQAIRIRRLEQALESISHEKSIHSARRTATDMLDKTRQLGPTKDAERMRRMRQDETYWTWVEKFPKG